MASLTKQEESLIQLNKRLAETLALKQQIGKGRPKRTSTKINKMFEEELRIRRLSSNEE